MATRKERRELAELNRRERDERDGAILAMRGEGKLLREIAVAFGLSKQRVAQIVARETKGA